jgi:AcrR family transcriptional regulator
MASSASDESGGRPRQKARTRAALVAAARELMAAGDEPTVEQVAVAAGTSRTTAYRYFPNHLELVRAAFPDLDRSSLLGESPPSDLRERVERTLDGQFRILREWEPQLRAALRVSLHPGAAAPALRGGRAVGWFTEALAVLAETHPEVDRRRLAVRLRAVAGIEPYVWLRDVAGLSRKAAFDVMRRNALAVLADALDGAREGG